MSLGDRIRLAADRVDGQRALCKITGIGERAMSDYVGDRSSPKVSTLQKIADAASVSIVWLVAGSEYDENFALPTASSNRLLQVPRYDIQASAGAGRLVVSEHRDGWMAVDRDWLSRYVSRAAQVGVIEAVGDSMSPTIRNRDLLLVEVRDGFTAQDLMRGGVYVLTLDGGLVVKRLSIDGDTLIVGSDNPAHAEIRVPFAQIEDRAKIHGIVFWSGGALETHR